MNVTLNKNGIVVIDGYGATIKLKKGQTAFTQSLEVSRMSNQPIISNFVFKHPETILRKLQRKFSAIAFNFLRAISIL